MKKILFSLLLILPLVFTSCSDDEDNKDLNGTTWECKYSEEGYTSVETLQFSADKVVYTMVETEDGDETKRSESGTYVYNHPNISITILGQTMTGTISGSQLTTTDIDGDKYVFTKK